MDTKRFFLYFIVIAALALAGCGGNGGGTTAMPDPMPMPDPCPAGQERNADGDCVTPPPPGPTAEELTARADTKRKAIAAEAAQAAADDAGLGGSANLGSDGVTATTDGTATNDDPYSLTISRDRDGTEVKIEDSGLAGMDDPKFMQAADLGGGTTMHVRTMDANDDGDVVEEVVMVTTDIEAPRGRPFAMFEAADGTTPQALNALKSTGVATTDAAGDPNDSLIIPSSGNTAVLPLIMAGGFSAASGGSSSVVRTFLPAADDADATTPGNQPRAAAEVMGTYNGAMGTYTCTGTADCTATVNDKGEVTAVSDGWVFTPDRGATSDQPDYDYLSYGFWLKRTTDKDGVLTYNEVETFARSSRALSGDVSSVTGTATYSGGATGVYVHSVVNPDGSEASATSGHFMADAELTASFAQTVDDTTTPNVNEAGQIPPNMLNTLTGTIDNFRLSGHDQGPGWSVALEGDITPGTGLVTGGTAKGGGTDATFNAAFHGSTGADSTTQPSSVVGEFNANFSNGSVAGAFGATKN